MLLWSPGRLSTAASELEAELFELTRGTENWMRKEHSCGAKGPRTASRNERIGFGSAEHN